MKGESRATLTSATLETSTTTKPSTEKFELRSLEVHPQREGPLALDSVAGAGQSRIE